LGSPSFIPGANSSIGIGSTIAVQFPNGEMRAFEPEELEKASIAQVRRSKVAVPARGQDRVQRSANGVTSLATSVNFLFDNTGACHDCGGRDPQSEMMMAIGVRARRTTTGGFLLSDSCCCCIFKLAFRHKPSSPPAKPLPWRLLLNDLVGAR
jgi:hypothetical protein